MKELEKEMYFGATPKILENARALRKNMTQAEKILWEKLNRKQFEGLKFRRQHPINQFIADFYCHEIKLAIELDGEIHNYQKEYDIGRTFEIEKYGIRIIRFKNDEVINNLNEVLKKIRETIFTEDKEAVQKVRLTVIPAQAGICKFLIMRFLHSQE